MARTISNGRKGVRAIEVQLYLEDTYSFAVNTINIFIECNENIRAQLFKASLA